MSPEPITQNTLFYGDNLLILREYIPNENVDLIYLDPPFNSNRNYNVLCKDESGLDEELLQGAMVQMPPQYGTFKQVKRVREVLERQPQLLMNE